MYRVSDSLATYAVLLLSGAGLALIWANLDPGSYHDLVEIVLLDDFVLGHAYTDATGQVRHTLTLHFLVNHMLMALFFAMAAKEVWEAIILRDGSLRGRKAATPLLATAGGMLGPIAVYLALAAVLGSDILDALRTGWAIPTATDVAVAYLVGRIVFGAGHPALRFLLLLALADDAAGLIILATLSPAADWSPVWLLLSFGAALAAYAVFNWLPRRLDRGNQLRPNSTWVRRKLSIWPYVICGALSWYGFQRAGIHPVLGLIPIVPAIPHADRAFGLYAAAEDHLHDLLNEIDHVLRIPVQIALFLFGLCNAGIEVSSVSLPTWPVLAGLLIGKPLGVLLFGWVGARLLKLGLPDGMRIADLIVVGCIASIGFTVSLYIADAAFEPGPIRDAAKMGVLLSFGAGILAMLAGDFIRIRKQHL